MAEKILKRTCIFRFPVQRFISRKTVEGVVRQLREASKAASSGRLSDKSG